MNRSTARTKEKHKVLLVYPLQGGSGVFVRHIPLGLLYTSTKLVKQGVSVEIFDCRLNPRMWRDELMKKLDEETLMVGISVMTGSPVMQASKIGAMVKEFDSQINIVWGGPHATFNPQSILENEKNCDYVVNGYGNEVFFELYQTLKSKKTPSNMSGVVYREGVTIVATPREEQFEHINFKDIPYHLIPDYDAYGHIGHNNRTFSMYSSLGCPYLCTFCSSPAEYRDIPGKKWIPLEVQEVVDHVEYVVTKYKANFIYFIDDDSFVNLKHVEGVIDEINRRGLKVKLGFRGARINEIKKMTDEFLDKLVAAGTNIIHVGAESGSNRILKLIRKDCTAEDILECNRKLARHPEMKTLYNFMMGTPTETTEELNATRDLMLTIVRDHPNSIIGTPNRFRPLKNTELYDLAIENGYTPPSTANEWLEYEIESASGTDSLPWISEEMKKVMDLILIGSYFVDRKAMKVATGNTVVEKIVRLADIVYGPIARWRLRSGNTRFFIELPIYKFVNNISKSFTPNFESRKTKTPV
jgi:anaerobic magnesium-protoporphyrin IX monomethyl ester cyclase